MRDVGGVSVLVVAAAVTAAGCTRTFTGTAIQPNPLKHPNETLRHSEKITISRGDMDLVEPDAATGAGFASPVHNHPYQLRNVASFTIVSRDRLRFHVQVDHKWEDWADLKTWSVELEDDAGHKWVPESVEHARTQLITKMWDREQRSAICGGAGSLENRVDGAGNCLNTVGYADDGWKRRQTLGSLSVFRGKADFVFYQRDLFSANVRSLRLTVKRPGEVFQFTWRFEDDMVASE
jgi:hypothetical protein